MGRYGRRISRSLIGALVVTIILGMVFYLKNLTTTKAEQTETPAQANPPRPAPTPAPAIAIATPTVAPAITVTPTTMPQSASVAAAAPATRPAPQPSQTSPQAPLQGVLSVAQTRKSAGDLLGARQLLNDALLSGKLSQPDTVSVKQAMAEINKEVVFAPKRFTNDTFAESHSVASGERLARIAAKYEVTWELLMRLNGMTDPAKMRAGQTLKIIKGPFHAVVYKSDFTLDIYLGPPLEPGSMYVTTYKVGLGKDDSTPTGSWLVEAGRKLKNPTYFSPRGEGIIDADDPQNPLGERWIGLTGISGNAINKPSYGIHGTIDPASIGKMESMGCIRLLNSDVEWVFDLLVEGKSIVVVKE